jgi:hypothetical protein
MIIILTLVLLIKTIDSIPIMNMNILTNQEEEYRTIILYDNREPYPLEYELITSNMEVYDFVEYISPIPLKIDDDIICERKNNKDNDIEITMVSCDYWNQYKLYLVTDNYTQCNIKRNIRIFYNIIEYFELINNKC